MSQYTPSPFAARPGEPPTAPSLAGWIATQLARIGQAISLETWYATTVAAAYTLTPQDRLLRVNTTAAARTITLPLANTVPGQVFTIKNIGNAGNNVTVNRAGADTIDGGASITIASLAAKTLVAATSTAWDTV